MLLQRAGCLRPSEQVAYKHPVPRGPGYELLCIDDHAYLLRVPHKAVSKEPPPSRADQKIFARAGKQYASVNLRTSPKKAVRNAYKATILGGEIDGIRGDICAPRLKTVALCALTLELVLLGFTTTELLQSIIGSWIFVVMFRRPTMCLMSQVFHDIAQHARGEIFALSHDAKQELMLLILFAPCMTTDLRAKPLSKLFCSDASPFGARVCQSHIGAEATLELLRHADHKGFHTNLQPQLAAYLDNAFGTELLQPDDLGPVPRSMAEGFLFDVCEVFRGEGTLTSTFKEQGFTCHPGFDMNDGPHGDLLLNSTMQLLIGLICRRVICYFHLGLPCATFGTMRRPRLRSKVQPFGFDPDEPITRGGTLLAMRAALIMHLCAAYGLISTSETPLGSVMYRLDCFQRLRLRGFVDVKFCYCTYGTPYKKPSHWLCNRSEVSEMCGGCGCGAQAGHLRIERTFTHESVKEFCAHCKPDCVTVFGRIPKAGEAVCKMSGICPIPALRHLCRLLAPCIEDLKRPKPSTTRRPAHKPPRWIADLSLTLQWKVLLQYRFKRVNHINVNEELSFRSLLKHLAKTEPNSRFGALLDSRVTIGCNSKGRSSSQKLNFYLSTVLPHILGAGLYPSLFHVGTDDNVADDPSCLKQLRERLEVQPFWLKQLLSGSKRILDLVKITDDILGPAGLWARLTVLQLYKREHASACAF